MSSQLLSSNIVPEGFEIVIDNPDVTMGKIWNLWFNVTLSDDPEKWDAEILAINAIQSCLEGFTNEHRLIRGHMTEFCRYHPSFPNSIEHLCDEIGKSLIGTPPSLGCEGRGLLQSLGYHKEVEIDNEVRSYLDTINTALLRWRNRQKPETARDRQVSFFLAEPTDQKTVFVDELISVLNSNSNSILNLRKLAEGQCQIALEDVKKQGRPFNCFDCLPYNQPCPTCKCAYAMLPYAGILCANRPSPENPLTKVFLTFIQEHILVYAAALNSWLSEGHGSVPSALAHLASVSEMDVTEISTSVNERLGQKDPEKVWLAASLLKTIVGNQRWHKGRELIDDFPEVTSSLRRLAAG